MDCITYELGALAIKNNEAYFLLQESKVKRMLDQDKDIVVALPSGVNATKLEILVEQETAQLLTKRGKSLWVRQGPVQLQIYPGALLTRNFTRKVSAGEPARVLVELGASAEYKSRLQRLLEGSGFADYELVSDVYWIAIRGETATTGFDLESLARPVYVQLKVGPEELGEAEPDLLGLYQFSNSLKYLGGRLTENNPVRLQTELRDLAGFYAVLSLEKYYGDLRNHPAQRVILQLTSKHIFMGSTDDSFGPDLPLSRAETAVVFYRSLNISAYVPNASPFVDVSPKDWYFREVASIEKSGLMKGEGGRFQPQDSLSRQEMALIITRALAYKGDLISLTDQQVKDILKNVADEVQIARWAGKAVATVLNADLMETTEYKFEPNNPVTRGEGALIINKLMKRLNLF